jgi:ABC-type polysaccharide/polyol phosphate transport system ATPase subunit
MERVLSSGFTIVEIEHTAKPFTAINSGYKNIRVYAELGINMNVPITCNSKGM